MMKRNLFFYIAAFTVLFGWTSCDKDGDSKALPNGYVEQTVEGASIATLQGYENSGLGFSVLKPKNFASPLYIKDQAFTGANYGFMEGAAAGLDAMIDVPESGQWLATAPVVAGKTYWVRNVSPSLTRYLKLRVAYIMANTVGVEYVVLDKTTPGSNANSNAAYATDYESVMNLEIPALTEANQYIEYYADPDAKRVMNFALEYVPTMKHSAWVAFSFDTYTSMDNVDRKNQWEQDDPNIDNEFEANENMHKSDGYDKGHLVASEDRVYSRDANRQTFYYSNISPQIGAFNQKYWAALEKQVQTWGRSTQRGIYDKVYVAKGGTLNKLLTNFTGTIKANDGKYPTTDAEGKTVKGLPVPAYYYMAILTEKNGKYQAIGFYVPHVETLPSKPTADDFKLYAVSIQKLEQETGIDFFCNLPDDIEAAVESEYQVADWEW